MVFYYDLKKKLRLKILFERTSARLFPLVNAVLVFGRTLHPRTQRNNRVGATTHIINTHATILAVVFSITCTRP